MNAIITNNGKSVKLETDNLLFLDDYRVPIDCTKYMKSNYKEIYNKNWVVVRSYGQFVNHIKTNGLPDVISFDYDLTDVEELKESLPFLEWFDIDNNRDYKGLDCIKWLIKYCSETKQPLPDYIIHSTNPSGAEEMENLLEKAKNYL